MFLCNYSKVSLLFFITVGVIQSHTVAEQFISQPNLCVFLQQNDVAVLCFKLSVICQTANLLTERKCTEFHISI